MINYNFNRGGRLSLVIYKTVLKLVILLAVYNTCFCFCLLRCSVTEQDWSPTYQGFIP